MSTTATASIVFACVFGGALLGMFLRSVLPEHHLSSESKDVAKVAFGLVGTMAALVLGLLVSSAKGSYDAQASELNQLCANVVLLDRVLGHYGPETKPIRDGLRAAAGRIRDQMWSTEGTSPIGSGAEVLYDKIGQLAPADDKQRAAQSRAVELAMGLGQTRWLMYEQRTAGVSTPLLVVLVLWLTLIFASFGLFAPVNATVLVSLALAALSVAGAVFLILEMYSPYSGLIQISDAPLQAAMAQLGQ